MGENSFYEFIFFEQHRHSVGTSPFSVAFWSAYEMYEALLVTRERHDATLKEHLRLSEEAFDALAKGDPDGQFCLWDMRAKGRYLNVDIQGYYLFAKVLLDRLAFAIKTYFGDDRRARINRHSRMALNFKTYAEAKSLSVPEGMHDRIARLNERVRDYRDKDIAHYESLSQVRGSMWCPQPPTYQITRTGPNPSTASEPLHELADLIDAYVGDVMNLIALNRKWTRIPLRDSG